MKINWEKLGLAAIVVFVVLLIYHGWFNTRIIARGDWKAASSDWMLDYLGPPEVWNEADFGGFFMITGGALARFPLLNLQANLHKLFGLGFAWTERLVWFFPFIIISILSIYYLSKHLFGDTLVSFFSTIFFVSNNFIIFRLHGAQMNLTMGYALAPLCLYFFVRSLEEKRAAFSLLNAVVLSVSAYYELRLTVLILALEAAYGLYWVLMLSPNRRHSFFVLVKSFVIVGLVFLLLNIFWLGPLCLDFQNSLPSIPSLTTRKTLQSLSRTDLFNALVLSMGADSKKGGFIYLDSQLNSTVLLVFPLIIYGFSLLAKPRRDYIFWFAASLVLAFLAKGLNSPFGGLNAAFYSHLPLAAMFRLPTKFLMIGGVPISLCFGLGCGGTLSRIEESGWRMATLLGLSFLPLAVILPALFGSNSLKEMKGGSSFNPFLASEYAKFEKWLGQQEEGFKWVFLPGNPSLSFFSSRYPRYGLASGSQLQSSFGSYYKYRFETTIGLKSPDEKVLPEALRLLNVKYIFLAPPDDTVWPWYARGARSLFRDMLLGIEEFKKTENKNIFVLENPAPRFYLSRQLVLVDGEFEEVMANLIDSGVDLQTVTLVDEKVSGSVNSKEVSTLVPSDKFPEVGVEKLGNAKYKIKIFDPPEGRFYLNFQDGYDSNWQIDGTIKSSLSAAGTNYFELARNKLGGESVLELTLEHRLQKYLDIGWRTTQGAWLVTLAFLGLYGGWKLKGVVG